MTIAAETGILNFKFYKIFLKQIIERRIIRAGSVVNKLSEASDLLEKFVLEPELSDFLTLDAYDKLVSSGK